jgi:UDPglucose 6-dehydrogenase
MDAVVLALPTPEAQDGSSDVSLIENSLRHILPFLKPQALIVIRSTVPPGSFDRFQSVMQACNRADIHLMFVPEFMAMGQTYHDILHPKRMVIGSLHPEAERIIRSLYQYGEDVPHYRMHPDSACLTKYAANTFLATKISFINQIATIAEETHANIDDVLKGIQDDPRIGNTYLKPSVGFGGSCFPKDLRAMEHLATSKKVDHSLWKATRQLNDLQKKRFADRILHYFHHQFEGKKIAILGVSFKGTSKEVTHSPAFSIIDTLTDQKANLFVYDPHAGYDFIEQRGDKPCLAYALTIEDALHDADACVILSDLPELYSLKADDFIQNMKKPLVFDGRNMFSLSSMQGVEYHSIGRPTFKP